jgi:hypothetical protein
LCRHVEKDYVFSVSPHQAAQLARNGKTIASFCSASLQNVASILAGHASQKAAALLSLADRASQCAFHKKSNSVLLRNYRDLAETQQGLGRGCQPAKLASEAAMLLNNLRSWQVSVYAIISSRLLRPVVNSGLVKNLRFQPVRSGFSLTISRLLGALTRYLSDIKYA